MPAALAQSNPVPTEGGDANGVRVTQIVESAAPLRMTYDPKNQKLQVQRLNDVLEGREQALHVWAIAEDDTPRMLGVLTNKYKTQQLDVPTQALEGARTLAISVENKDRGPRDGKPRQPLLFKGWLVQKAI